MRSKPGFVKHLTFLFLLITVHTTFAQNNIGLNPPSIHWKQIHTPTGRIIFPRGLDSIAFRAAGIMNYERIHDSTISATGNTRHVPVIIQNQSTLPAGFSTPAPWRNEYYITPPQNLFLGPVPWMDGLVAHEYRHTQQFSVAHSGFTLPYQILFGETGWLLNTLFSQTLWLREGDAVLSETILTKGGRGRLPAFNMEYRALLVSGIHYGYEKGNYPSSFKDFVPNPYRIGYYMNTKARRDFGDDVWKNVLNDVYHKKGFIYSQSRAMQKYTGMGTKQFYDATIKELDSIFKHTDATLQLTPARNVIAEEPHVFTSYKFPQYLPDGSLVSLKSALNEIYTYFKITPDGKEKKLFSPGIYSDDQITTVVEGNLMTWCESSFSARWINKDYSIIKMYDFETGKTRKITSKTKYFSPAPSHDGQKIIAVKMDEIGTYSLLVLDSKKGDVLKELPNPENVNYVQPRWMEDDRHIVTLALTAKGVAIVIIDPESGMTETVLNYTSVDVTRPFPKGDYIYFTAGYSGIDNIYAIRLIDKKIFQITSSRFGAFEPAVSPDGKKLVYSDYSANGYRIKEITLDPSAFKVKDANISSDIKFHEKIMSESGKDLSAVSFPPKYDVTKYHALTDGLLNIYGWFPIPFPPEYGAEFYTQNIMSTLRATLGILYNTNENNPHSYLRLTYAALYPEVEAQYEYGLNRNGKNYLSSTMGINSIHWTENIVSAGLRFPFRLTQGTHITSLSLGGFFQYYDVTDRDTLADIPMTDHFFFYALTPELRFSRLKVQARQQVKPRWGQTLNASYISAINSEPERLLVVSQLFFPGIIKTHSLNFSLSYKQEKVIDIYRFKDDFIMPRGYKPYPFETQYSAYINYELPLWYPDIAAGPVLFFQRFRLNLFYDLSQGKVNHTQDLLSSTGAELFADIRLFRLFRTTMGVRYSYTFNSQFEKTMPVQFLVTLFELAN